jgi:hypothetical protein
MLKTFFDIGPMMMRKEIGRGGGGERSQPFKSERTTGS